MTKYVWRQSVRVVLILQVALIAFFVAWGYGWIEDSSGAAISDAPPGWIEWFFLYFVLAPFLILTFYAFPLWTLIPAWKSDLPAWKLWLLFLIELALWATLILATLPMVQ